MPILDVIAFEFSEDPDTSSALQRFLETLRDYEGVMSAWQGIRIEGPAQYHILVFWDSLPNLTAASKDSYHPYLPTTLPIMRSSLLRRQFVIDEDPEAALTAPITDMSTIFVKQDCVFEKDLKPILVKFTELEETGALGSYWGHSVDVEGLAIVLAGWNSIKERDDAINVPAFAELALSSIPVAKSELKYIPFEQVC